jgi:glutamate N-acetyltransferase/amino-acid N-acetyltransferase
VFLASTGVIGEPLPKGKIEAALPKLWAAKSGDSAAWDKAARAIMTTDTYPKGATRTAKIGGVPVTINGIAKGSGMIAPDLGTMLSYIFTDAALPASVLQTLLVLGVRDTFNAITVDSDTSTSDMVLLFATGQGERHEKVERAGEPRLREFRAALHDLMGDLARQVICDGEGATKLVRVQVKGAASAKAARAIALSIANSPLVKTAIAGEDANWGRVIMAVGKAGEEADRDKLTIKFGGLPVARNGGRDSHYDEAKTSAYMKGKEIAIEVHVGIGEGEALIWTCDLTHGYIDINGSYRS